LIIFFDISLDDFLRRRAKLARVTNQLNEKVFRGFFQTLYWRRRFLAQRSTPVSYAGAGKYKTRIYLIVVPAIIVEESEPSSLPVPRPAMLSLDLTQMRNDMGTGYSPTSPSFGRDPLQTRSSPQSAGDDDSNSPFKTWSNIGGPESQVVASAAQPELYGFLKVATNI
jgi:hypothetical protein